MITIAFMLLVGFLAVGVIALVIARSATLDHEKTMTRLHESGAQTLVYEVPNGQDPVEVTVALARAGFTAVGDTEKGMCQVLVECPHGRLEDRARVRAVIEQTSGGDAGGAVVQFAGER
ncbi:MAG TPA: hypothetical protein VH419_12725 [Nocardioidaceae bacterium]